MTETPVTASFSALGTTATVAVVDPGSLAVARELLVTHLEAVDRTCSRFRPDSELTRVNAHTGTAVRISFGLARAVRAALDAARMTDGHVDPTLGAQLRAAGYDRTFALVRERASWRIVAAPPHRLAWSAVKLDDAKRLLLVPTGVELDLGATAKALAADDAAQAIAEATGTGALVGLGGDIAVAGPPPTGGWSVLIADNHAAPLKGPGPTVAISSGGLATSSTAVRRWRTDAGESHHILDPRSGEPTATPWRSVSVAAATCLDANVAATAAIVLGESAIEWLTARSLPSRAVRRDGSVVTLAGWPAEARAA